MSIKAFKPYTPSRRFTSFLRTDELDQKRPEKRLTEPLHKKAGRSHGKVSVRHRGGGHKRLYRRIDFKRDKWGVMARVVALEYDPNRSANIALLQYEDGEKRYILAPTGLKRGDELMSGDDVEIKVGSALPLMKVPIGSVIHNIELMAGGGGRLVRSAGQAATLMAREGGLAQIKLGSGEIRLIHEECLATLGRVSNPDHQNIVLGKAGRVRHRGWRPQVRGTAMPAGEHPHGGGEGRTGTGRPAKTYKGKPAKGKKTRKKNKKSSKMIIQPRR